MTRRRERLRFTLQRLVHPRRRLQDLAQRADEAWLRLRRGMKSLLGGRGGDLKVLNARLARQSPDTILKLHRGAYRALDRRLHLSMTRLLTRERAQLQSLIRAFEAVGPQQTLGRGYAIITTEETGEILREADSVRSGEQIRAETQARIGDCQGRKPDR